MSEDRDGQRGAGRPRFARNVRTINEEALRDAAQDALSDELLVLRPERVAYALQIHVRTATELIESGILPSIQIPVRMGDIIRVEKRVPCQALVDWIDSNTCGRVTAAQSGRS